MRAPPRSSLRQRAVRAVNSIQYAKRGCAGLLLLGMAGAYFLFHSNSANSVQGKLWSEGADTKALAMGKPKDMHIKWWTFIWRGTLVPGKSSPEPTWYPCWWGKYSERPSSRVQFVTLVTSGGSELHRYQVADAAAIAYVTNSTLVIPMVREAENEPNAQFGDLYDVRQFVKSFEGVIRVINRLGPELLEKQTVIRTPRMASRGWIEENIIPLFQNSSVVQVGPYDKRLENKEEVSDEELDAVRCMAAYHSLQISEHNIQRLGERMLERVREAAFKTGGKFLAVDMRGGSSGHNAENCPPLPFSDNDGWHIPETDNLRKVAIAKQRTRDSKCAASPEDVSRFLKSLGYPKSTAVYNTASRYDKKFHAFGKHFRNIVTKDYTLPFNEETQFWWTGKSQVESMLDIFMCVHADVFVSAVPGPFRNIVAALRRLRGVLPVVRVSTLSLFDVSTLTKDEAQGLLVEMFEENLKPSKKVPKEADVCKHPETFCFCDQRSRLAPVFPPPPAHKGRRRGDRRVPPPVSPQASPEAAPQVRDPLEEGDSASAEGEETNKGGEEGERAEATEDSPAGDGANDLIKPLAEEGRKV